MSIVRLNKKHGTADGGVERLIALAADVEDFFAPDDALSRLLADAGHHGSLALSDDELLDVAGGLTDPRIQGGPEDGGRKP